MGKKKIKMEVMHVGPGKSQQGYVLSLIEIADSDKVRRKLPIVIGGYEAQAIVIALEKLQTSRPLVHELFQKFANTVNVKITEIIINKFSEGVFYALVLFSDGVDQFEIDARTSDAVALALRFNCPIYTYAEILNVAGVHEDSGANALMRERKQEVIENSISEDEFGELSLEKLNELLKEAVENEDYEKASRIRDEINNRK